MNLPQILPKAFLILLLPVSVLFFSSAKADTSSFCDSEACQKDMKKLEDLAYYGSGEAATLMAVAYLNGDGVEQNLRKARTYILKAVQWREPMGLLQMSVWVRNGIIFEQDLARADQLLDRAVALKFAPAMYDKAKLLIRNNRPEDDAQAIALLEEAESLYFLPARYLLAGLLASGTATELHLERAALLYKNLALRNYKDSRMHLDAIIDVLDDYYAASQETSTNKHLEPLLAELKKIDDIEVMEVRGSQLDVQSELTHITQSLDNLNLYRRGNSGSRIPGKICSRTAFCSTVYDPSNGDVISSGLGDYLGQNINHTGPGR